MNYNHSYVFVTDKKWLWINATKAYYPTFMLKNSITTEFFVNSKGRTTIFVKIDKNGGKVQEVHEGRIAKIELRDDKIHFEYDSLKPISKDKYFAFNKSGCYLDTNNYSQMQKESRYQKELKLLLELTNNENFENKVHELIYQFHVDLRIVPRKEQAGKSDGFFKINRLNVLYDATLQGNFETFKATQIDNFVSQMKKRYIDFGKERFSLDVESEKQVWIVTKNHDQHIRTEDGIKIRAVSVSYLYNLLERFNSNFPSNEEQSKLLSNL